MAVAKVDTKSRWIGLAGDTPPTATEMGSEFYETDTGKHYVWNGTWTQYVNNGYFGSLFPIADNTYDLGSAALSWRQAHIETVVYATSVLGNWSPSADNTYTLGTATLGWLGLHMPDTYITDDTGVVKFRNNANNADVGIAALTGIIDQAGADTAILSLRSTGDVATGLTTGTNIVDVTATDYGALSKFAAATGGLLVQALGENAAVTTNLSFESYGGQADTTKSTAGRGMTEIYVTQHDGSNALANVTADGNIVAIRSRVGGADVAQAIISAPVAAASPGGLWLNGGITIGGPTPLGYVHSYFGGNFASDGAATSGVKQYYGGILTGAGGDTNRLLGSEHHNVVVTQNAAETVGIVAQAAFYEPSITKNVTTITVAATIYVADAPTEGTTNAAIYVAGGDTILQRLITGGGPPLGNVGNYFAGNFTSDGSSTVGAKFYLGGTLIGASGDTGRLIGTEFHNLITTQTAAETVGIAAQVALYEPAITLGGGSSVTIASTLYIADAPTEGTTNAAIYVASGDVRVAGNATYIGSTATGANGMILINPKNAAASGLSGTQLDVEIDIGGTPYYFTVYPTKA